MLNVQPVILCGGSGVRLWPLSRSGFPKQFLCLTCNESLFQLAARRLAGVSNTDIKVSAPFVVTNEEHRFLAFEQLREINISASRYLLEPFSRNTAPALTLAALTALESGNDPVLVVTPADQVVSNIDDLTTVLREAVNEAEAGSIVTLGVRPNCPETGYGYIQVEPKSQKLALKVLSFTEKPDARAAQKYLNQGNYFWNAGIFVMKASIWLAALDQFRPDILSATKIAWQERKVDDYASSCFVRPSSKFFQAIPNESIDYAVMEKCPDSKFPIKMLPLNAGWSDLGNWDAVWQDLPKDDKSNAHIGDVLSVGSSNTLAYATDRLVCLVGVDNLIVVETPDAILVAQKSRSQDVRNIVKELQASSREELTTHRKVHRPWGWYDNIDIGERFKVKRIQVKPKASLSLQKHHHRAEHWIIVKGTAKITNGEKTILLTENQSTYIPLGEIHRLSNPGNIPLEIIEVQSGSYLEESDIVRFEDPYGRTS